MPSKQRATGERTRAEVAQHLHLSTRQVRRAEESALRKLRESPLPDILRDLAEVQTWSGQHGPVEPVGPERNRRAEREALATLMSPLLGLDEDDPKNFSKSA